MRPSPWLVRLVVVGMVAGASACSAAEPSGPSAEGAATRAPAQAPAEEDHESAPATDPSITELAASVFARDAASGRLYFHPKVGDGDASQATLVGEGWDAFDVILGPGDVDGDGLPDLLARETSSGNLLLYPGTPGTPGTPATSRTSGTRSIGFGEPRQIGNGWNTMALVLGPGDFDGDGFVDVLARDHSDHLLLYPGDGKGLGKPSTIAADLPAGGLLVAAGDLDENGFPDLVARDPVTKRLQVYLNDGKGGLSTPLVVPADAAAVDLALGGMDFDGDGHADLLTRDGGSGDVFLWGGDGKGGLAPPVRAGTHWSSVDMMFGLTTTFAPLPSGRGYFVATVLGDRVPNAGWVRLAEITLASNGTAAMDYWYWNQAAFTGDATTNKVVTATTKGCHFSCNVKAPLGFQRGARPKSKRGTFRRNAAGDVVLRWPDGSETWSVSDQGTFTKLDFRSSTLGITGGWSFGSRTPLDKGVTIDEVARSKILRGPYWANAYDAPTVKLEDDFPFSAYERCTSDEAMQNVSVSNPDKTKRWNSYLAGDPAVDGRKMYWNHDLGVVTQHETPGADCISWGGGHNFALLQVLDDAGGFVGWISAEASQHGKYKGGDMISIDALLR